MGTGKSTAGHLAAAQLGFKFLDTDELIEAHVGKPIPRIFAEDGEEVFRRIEREVAEELAQQRKTVIATGGGLGANATLLEGLKRHSLVVCLWASPEQIWERVRHQSHRPLLQVPDPLERIRVLLAQREPVYRQADVLINTGYRQSREVVQQLLFHFHLASRTRPPRDERENPIAGA